MAIIRSKHLFDGQFTQIPNHWLRDARLSLKSIGLIAQIMSHSPGWNMSIRSLATANNCGTESIKTAIEELEKFGYLERLEQKHDDQGRFAGYDFMTKDPGWSENTVTGKPRDGETVHKEYYSSKEENLNKNYQENTFKKKPHKLPEDWTPSSEDWQVMEEHFPEVDLKLETHSFRDYWNSVAESKAKKVDWDATWRNWIRNAHKRSQTKREQDFDKLRKEAERELRNEEG